MVSCLVHARKRPYGPLTRRYAPTAAVALPGPLRPRTAATKALFVGIAYQGGGGLAEPIKPLPATPGFGATHFPFTIEHRLAPF